MGLGDDLQSEVAKIFKEHWTVRDGQKVPETDDLPLKNEGSKISGTVLYADLADSSGLVASHSAMFAAEIYKTYLNCACRVIRGNGGVVTAFDGDRVMAVFIGSTKNTSALKTALQINYAVTKIINPALIKVYPKTKYRVAHAVGVDTSELLVARTGIRGANDLVWVGNAANTAAKLCSLRSESYASWCTKAVHDAAQESARTTKGSSMWEARTWTARGKAPIYRSSWTWRV